MPYCTTTTTAAALFVCLFRINGANNKQNTGKIRKTSVKCPAHTKQPIVDTPSNTPLSKTINLQSPQRSTLALWGVADSTSSSTTETAIWTRISQRARDKHPYENCRHSIHRYSAHHCHYHSYYYYYYDHCN